jgi:hypothetical protein
MAIWSALLLVDHSDRVRYAPSATWTAKVAVIGYRLVGASLLVAAAAAQGFIASVHAGFFGWIAESSAGPLVVITRGH